MAQNRARDERADKREEALKDVSNLSRAQCLKLALNAVLSTGLTQAKAAKQYDLAQSTLSNYTSRILNTLEGKVDQYTKKHRSAIKGRPPLLTPEELENLRCRMHQRDIAKNSFTTEGLKKHIGEHIVAERRAQGFNSAARSEDQMVSTKSVSRITKRLGAVKVNCTTPQNKRRLEAREDLSNYLSLIAVWVQALMGDAPVEDDITDSCSDGDSDLNPLLQKVQCALISRGTDY